MKQTLCVNNNLMRKLHLCYIYKYICLSTNKDILDICNGYTYSNEIKNDIVNYIDNVTMFSDCFLSFYYSIPESSFKIYINTLYNFIDDFIIIFNTIKEIVVYSLFVDNFFYECKHIYECIFKMILNLHHEYSYSIIIKDIIAIFIRNIPNNKLLIYNTKYIQLWDNIINNILYLLSYNYTILEHVCDEVDINEFFNIMYRYASVKVDINDHEYMIKKLHRTYKSRIL